MNKTALKSFAVEARKKLHASIEARAGWIGITKESITEAVSLGEDFAVFPTQIGVETTLYGQELKQRKSLVRRIKAKGYDAVIEETAYTWFNRIIAIRFMEVNDYLPSRIRVLSSEIKGKFEPDIVTQAPNVDLELSRQELEEILRFKEHNEQDKLFRLLFIKQCQELGEILPALFKNNHYTSDISDIFGISETLDISNTNNSFKTLETTTGDDDYTELLLNISYTNQDGIIRDLLKIDEEDFLEAVEIVGWMYQFYNTEPKALVDTYVGKQRVPKQDVPAKTQLFTPDWIVRYMVENSLGRLWLEGHENPDLKAKWGYFVDEATQEIPVEQKLATLSEEYKRINPEEIKVLDPCMGSGHILVYAFEILMQIYESCGYTQRDAAQLIVEKNLYGLDIDDRACQLAYFAVMMKGRKYDRRFLTKKLQPNLYSIQESNTLGSINDGESRSQFNDRHRQTGNYLQTINYVESANDLQTVNYLVEAFRDAKEYGSILHIEAKAYDGLISWLKQFMNNIDRINGLQDNCIEVLKNNNTEVFFVVERLIKEADQVLRLAKQAKLLTQNYDIVVTNPPYFSASDMSPKLMDFVKNNFPVSRADLFAVFIEKCLQLSKPKGYTALVTMQSWMYLSSYEELRHRLMSHDIINMIHLGARAFEEIGGEIVQTTAFVLRQEHTENYKSAFIRLVDYKGENLKRKAYLVSLVTGQDQFIALQDHFKLIPGSPIAYRASENLLNNFTEPKLDEIVQARQGLACGDVNKFRRYWYEVKFEDINLNAGSISDFLNSHKKYAPINDGGEYRKWYGNNGPVLRFDRENYDILQVTGNHLPSRDMYFQPGITWTAVTSSDLSLRSFENGFLFTNAGMAIFGDALKIMPILALLNSKVSKLQISSLNESLNYNKGDIARLPVHHQIFEHQQIIALTKENVRIAKQDWSQFETDWNFKQHPLVACRTGNNKLKDAFVNWEQKAEEQFQILKQNEEDLNRIFITIYNLENEVTPEVNAKDITLNRADLKLDILSFISYAVGCMFGRYSLDIEGLAYAGGKWNDEQYRTYIPVQNNIILITDEEYFEDDMVARFVSFMKAVYGEETLEENLDFIAGLLGYKGNTSRQVIRNYFLKDFFKDHVRRYRKCPIYWLFDSGKENGFKALIYLHRYNEDTAGCIRVDYLHKMQAAIENAIADCDSILLSSAPAGDKAKAVKQKEKLIKQLAETHTYDQAIAHIALQRISLDLDDGVKANYAKFQGVLY